MPGRCIWSGVYIYVGRCEYLDVYLRERVCVYTTLYTSALRGTSGCARPLVC